MCFFFLIFLQKTKKTKHIALQKVFLYLKYFELNKVKLGQSYIENQSLNELSIFMKKQTICVLLHFWAFTICAQTIKWQPKQVSIPAIGQQVSILEDKTHHLTLEQVASDSFQGQFAPHTQKIFNTEVSGSHYWVRFTLDNSTTEPLILEVAQPLLDSVFLSFKDSTGLWRTVQNGYSVPLYQKDIKHNYHLFHLPQGKTTFYFRFQDNGWAVPLSIWNENTYEMKATRQKLIYGIYIGVMAFVILTNIFWYFSLGWSSNLQYAFFVASYALFSGIYDGYICYFFPDLHLMHWRFVITFLNNVSGLVYMLSFLEIKKYAPAVYRFGMLYLGYYALFTLFRFRLPTTIDVGFDQFHGLMTILLICYGSVAAHRKGNKLGIYYAATYILFFLIALIEVIYTKTGAPIYLFDISYISLAILLEVFSLAYLLSKRLEWENTAKEKAKEKAQKSLLVQTQENERILANQNEILEIQVDERTAELQKSLGIIQEQSDKLTVLMKELHHRVKNNLQIVSSLLNIQAYGLKDKDAVKALQESKHRVDAMSLIHQSLYQTNDVSALDIKSYIRHLCEGLMAAYGHSYHNFNLQIDVPQIYLNVDSAIPIGLIINELVTNSFKYAYKKGQKPLLKVTLSMENELILSVSDNGTTFKKEDWERPSMSFGKQLIHSLTRQINGQLSLNTDLGTHFSIRFPKPVSDHLK
jgi:two-component sensor histidine kinase